MKVGDLFEEGELIEDSTHELTIKLLKTIRLHVKGDTNIAPNNIQVTIGLNALNLATAELLRLIEPGQISEYMTTLIKNIDHAQSNKRPT